jgi:hypothetical protein
VLPSGFGTLFRLPGSVRRASKPFYPPFFVILNATQGVPPGSGAQCAVYPKIDP